MFWTEGVCCLGEMESGERGWTDAALTLISSLSWEAGERLFYHSFLK